MTDHPSPVRTSPGGFPAAGAGPPADRPYFAPADHAWPGYGPLAQASTAAPYFATPGGAASGWGGAGERSSLGPVRRDFPALDQRINGRRLVWLDNAATTHKPRVVIERLRQYYARENSNVHRAAHTLAARATAAYEDARSTVARFLGAQSSEIVFVRGATEAINLVAYSAGTRWVQQGDEIAISELEHHSNIVPWQLLAERTGAVIRMLPADEHGNLSPEGWAAVIGPRTRIVAVTQVSNALGTVVPLEPLVLLAHSYGALVMVDGAQAVAHLPVNVATLGADFYAFSGHKVFGPMGIGVLFGKRQLLESMPPWQGGGSMIDRVTIERSTYAAVPAKFEAGTGNIAGAVGLAAALEYVEALGRPAIAAHEQELMSYLLTVLAAIPRLRIIGDPPVRTGALSFVIEGLEPAAVARQLDREGIAVRAGHHCAQPILRRFGLEATVRPSLAMYNTAADIDALGACLGGLTRG